VTVKKHAMKITWSLLLQETVGKCTIAHFSRCFLIMYHTSCTLLGTMNIAMSKTQGWCL
jgi:hypothetical protein